MDQELFKQLLGQGIFCALFIWLFLDTRKDSKEREQILNNTIKESQEIISNLAQKLNLVEEIKEDVQDIKSKISN